MLQDVVKIDNTIKQIHTKTKSFGLLYLLFPFSTLAKWISSWHVNHDLSSSDILKALEFLSRNTRFFCWQTNKKYLRRACKETRKKVSIKITIQYFQAKGLALALLSQKGCTHCSKLSKKGISFPFLISASPFFPGRIKRKLDSTSIVAASVCCWPESWQYCASSSRHSRRALLKGTNVRNNNNDKAFFIRDDTLAALLTHSESTRR